MDFLTISSVSMKSKPMDISYNLSLIIKILETDECKNSDLILFPELCITGYGCEDGFYRSSLWESAENALQKIIALSDGRTIVVGLPIYRDGKLYNASAVISNQILAGVYPKMNLAGTGIHYEYRHFSPYDPSTIGEIDLCGQSVPFGECLFYLGNWSFGIEICEDSWAVKRPSHKLVSFGADIILSPGASHFSIGKRKMRTQIFAESSRAEHNVFVFSNLCGNESGRVIFDGGALIACNGNITCEGEYLHFSEFTTVTDTLHLQEIRSWKVKSLRMIDRPPHAGKIHKIQLPNKKEFKKNKSIQSPKNKSAEISKYDEFTQAVALGLFDYLIRSKSKGFTVSLSGGADSSACALLVYLMKESAKKELGESCFSDLGIQESLLLTTVYQKTINNSQRTEDYAKLLAENLGSKHYVINIQKLFEDMTSMAQTSLGTKFEWNQNDLLLQNVQARIRSVQSWIFANFYNHLLISTGNRSEASLGYLTMDGDSSGSLAPIAGVSKIFLLEWLRYISEKMRQEGLSLPILESIASQHPSAELRPLEDEQEDEKDLMPYSLLQDIEELYVKLCLCQEEILHILSQKEKYKKMDLTRYINNFIAMFQRAQWKRERLAPSFYLDEYGLDPKSALRYPILN